MSKVTVIVTGETGDLIERLRNFRVWNNRQSRYEPAPVCQEAAKALERLHLGEALQRAKALALPSGGAREP